MKNLIKFTVGQDEELTEKLQQALLATLKNELGAEKFDRLMDETEVEGMIRDQANELEDTVTEELEMMEEEDAK